MSFFISQIIFEIPIFPLIISSFSYPKVLMEYNFLFNLLKSLLIKTFCDLN